MRTVETAAELNGYVLPIFRPLQERWFDVDVVSEDDSAIALWHETVRDFCQMLRDTGAFRDVRAWRLRIPSEADGRASDPSRLAYLETPSGGRARRGSWYRRVAVG